MNGYHSEAAGPHPTENEIAMPAMGQLSQQPAVLPLPFSGRRARPLQIMGISAAEPRVSDSEDGIHLPRLGDRPAPQLSQDQVGPILELIREVDAFYGPPWNPKTQGKVSDRRGPDGFHPWEGDAESFEQRQGAAASFESTSQRRNANPGSLHRRSDGSVVYVPERTNGQPVPNYDAGPPTFQRNEVQPEAGGGWSGDGEQVNVHTEVPVDDEWAGFLREIGPDYLLYEQWDHDNPPPESPPESQYHYY